MSIRLKGEICPWRRVDLNAEIFDGAVYGFHLLSYLLVQNPKSRAFNDQSREIQPKLSEVSIYRSGCIGVDDSYLAKRF